jgi:hypothetical protein
MLHYFEIFIKSMPLSLTKEMINGGLDNFWVKRDNFCARNFSCRKYMLFEPIVYEKSSRICQGWTRNMLFFCMPLPKILSPLK